MIKQLRLSCYMECVMKDDSVVLLCTICSIESMRIKCWWWCWRSTTSFSDSEIVSKNRIKRILLLTISAVSYGFYHCLNDSMQIYLYSPRSEEYKFILWAPFYNGRCAFMRTGASIYSVTRLNWSFRSRAVNVREWFYSSNNAQL